VEVFRLAGGDQITALAKGEVDAFWTVEHSASRLLAEAGGEILFREEEFWPEGRYATALLVVRKKFLEEHPEWVRRWLATHLETLEEMGRDPDKARRLLNEELKRETGKPLPEAYLESAYRQIVFTADPMKETVLEAAERAFQIGFLGRGPIVLGLLYDLSLLAQTGGSAEDGKFR